MANQLFAGFLYTGAGAAVQSATVELFDRNTTTPVRASTTTDANGYWAISHATEGRFDVRITNGLSISFIKYDDSFQVETIETAVLRVRNPADTFDLDLVVPAITADRQLNFPLITGTDTLVAESLAATLLNKTLTSPVINTQLTGTAVGTGASQVSAGDHSHAVAIIREGGNTTEATTTSTSNVDVLSLASLTIAALEPFYSVASWRKTTGAADDIRCGIKFNATQLQANQNIGGTTDAVDNGCQYIESGARLTSYTGGSIHKVTAFSTATILNQAAVAAAAPTASITDLVFTGQVDNASITLGMDEGHAYSYATS